VLGAEGGDRHRDKTIVPTVKRVHSTEQTGFREEEFGGREHGMYKVMVTVKSWRGGAPV